MKKILVIDDEAPLRDLARMALGQQGYEVLETDSGATGVRIARTTLPDLILCDIMMRPLDGYAVLTELHNDPLTAAIPVILITGVPDSSSMRQGMELGADDFLQKPFTAAALCAAVQARLKKAQTFRQQAEQKLSDLRNNISLMLPHELRTPLNGLLAYGEILATESATLPPQEVAEMGRVIYNSSKHLERLIENFLIYAQIELLGTDAQKITALRAGRTSAPSSLVAERARHQAMLVNRTNDLVLELEDVSIPISEDYLGRIVDELVQNAFKFSPAGSPVTVRLAATPLMAQLSVTDAGRGFSTEHITRVGAYMQFERKLHEQQGLGLGLTIAKRLTELHGGVLSIESERGNRTAAIVKLPIADNH